MSLLITGDEEGPAINGTTKLLDWAAGKGESWDAAIVGEPTNPDALGDMIKIGRRGSLSGVDHRQRPPGPCRLSASRRQSGARADAARRRAAQRRPSTTGTKDFQPTNLEVTSIDVGNPAANVIPAKATLAFNIRFNDTGRAETLQAEIHNRLDRASAPQEIPQRPQGTGRLRTRLARPAEPGLPDPRREADRDARADRSRPSPAGTPELSTSGGTSDARFIKDYCPVVEFGLVGKTMHMVDERVALADLETLTRDLRAFPRRLVRLERMPSVEDIQQYLTGAWRMMMGKPDGLRLLDISADGFWNSFFAIVVALPALIVGWVGRRQRAGSPAP